MCNASSHENFETFSQINIVQDEVEQFLNNLLNLSTSWEEDGIVFKSTIYNSLSYHDGKIKLLLSEIGKTILLEIYAIFTSYELQDFLNLKSLFAQRFYLFLLENRLASFQLSPEELKHIFCPPKNITTWNLFKKKILDKSLEELNASQHSNISYDVLKNGKNISHITFQVTFHKSENLFKSTNVSKQVITYDSQEYMTLQKLSELKKVTDEKSLIIKEETDGARKVVEYFDKRRCEIQPNFRRVEYKNVDGIYQLRIHMKETGRTPEMFINAINWLFSNKKEAEFHRAYIMTIGKLIEKFNTLEHLAMYSKESIKMSEEAQSWVNVYRKQGLKDDEIMKKLKEGGYI
jgi:plasmid replication initiation protein